MATGGSEMNKLLSNLGEALAWIWMTPEEARRLLGQRDPRSRSDAPGRYAKAA
jgi:hypothetical protein